MPRYVVTMCDVHTQEIQSWIVKYAQANVAVTTHPWISEVYLDQWIRGHILKHSLEDTIAAILENLGYVTCVVNLDEEIMNDLNAGDSSVSSSQHQA